jgi:hypothetical protein
MKMCADGHESDTNASISAIAKFPPIILGSLALGAAGGDPNVPPDP